HIVTIEDPIEFTHKSRRCLVNQREVGVHTKSFANALRAALREDPDVVLVGEMRDLETIEIALRTAETGHLVYGTLHTTTAISTINRIIDQFPADQQEQIRLMLADTLSAVIAQVLLPRIGGGRVAAREVLLITPAVANLIRTAKTFQIASVMQTHKSQGMMTLNDSLMELVENKIVDPKEAYLKAVEKRALIGRMRAAGISTQFLDTVTDTDAEEFEGTGSRKRPAEAQESGPQPPGRRRDGEQQRDEAVPPRAAAGAGR
ncbi:MAG: type IV pilus twitching motility protein PilT, partial [Thermoanaerobaculia bacterium]|nr:type IV pilus twitching motility protein PilT [Thermoanaerobaculia bacterium]